MSKQPPSESGRYTSMPSSVASQAIPISAIAPSDPSSTSTTNPSCHIGRLGRGELDGWHVAPELLEPVVLPRLRREDVEDDIEVVGQDPIALRGALDGSRPELVVGLEALANLVHDRLRLARVPAATEHEEVGVGADRPKVEDDDVLRQLLLGEAGDQASLFE
jgi:hypothetical protein